MEDDSCVDSDVSKLMAVRAAPSLKHLCLKALSGTTQWLLPLRARIVVRTFPLARLVGAQLMPSW